MRESLEIIIKTRGFSLCLASRRDEAEEFAYDQGITFGERLKKFCGRHKISGARVNMYVSEDLLFFKRFELPLSTPDLKDAVGYQLQMLTPFADEVLFAFTGSRRKDNYQVILAAVGRQPVESYVQEVVAGGHEMAGLYPESQRYVSRASEKKRWVLVMPGRFTKIFIFSGQRLEDRILSNTDPDYAELSAVCGSEVIYHLLPPEGQFQDARQLAVEKPLLKDFNLLPDSYRRPDYFRIITVALLALNVFALLALAGVKEYRLKFMSLQVENEMAKIMPMVREMNELRAREKELEKAIKGLEGIGRNPDLINFMADLTNGLPENSYLDQMRMDRGGSAVKIQGYTDDIAELTSKLQEMGESKLKSTSRRKNKNYFQMEISLP